MSFFKRLRWVFSHGPEIDELLEAARKEREDQEREENKYRLHLCHKHRQEPNHSHYSEYNCDYCRLLKNPDIKDFK